MSKKRIKEFYKLFTIRCEKHIVLETCKYSVSVNDQYLSLSLLGSKYTNHKTVELLWTETDVYFLFIRVLNSPTDTNE